MTIEPNAAQVQNDGGQLVRGLKLFDATTIIVGSMIGSGIFISADMARSLNSPGLLIVAWIIAAVMTILAALSYGELAAAMPHAGGQYVFLREAFGPLFGFLYGWTFCIRPARLPQPVGSPNFSDCLCPGCRRHTSLSLCLSAITCRASISWPL
jgi:amino acid permease